MSILAASTTELPANPWLNALGVVLLLGPLASIAIARAVGVFRPPGILGPERLEPRESPLTLFGILLFAIGVYVLIPSLYAQTMRAERTGQTNADSAQAPTTLPATAPATSPTTSTAAALNLTPKELVTLNALGGAGALVVLLGGNLLFRPRGLPQLGLGPHHLLHAVTPAFLGTAFVLPLMAWVGVASAKLWQLLGLKHPQKHELLEYLDNAQDPALSTLIVVSAVVLAPLYEEFLFRGHLQTALSRLFSRTFSGGQNTDPAASPPGLVAGRWTAVLVTSLLFAVIHPWWTIPPIFFLSVVLGFVYERTGNLYAVILLHALFNASSVLLSRFAAMT